MTSAQENPAIAQDDVENPHAESVLTLANAMLRDISIWVGAVIIVAAIAMTVWKGLPGLYGALIGGVIAFASALATILMMRKTATMPPMFVMVVSLGGYIGKIIVLFLVMTALRYVPWLDRLAVAITMLVVISLAAFVEVRAFRRTKIPTLIIPKQ